MDLVSLAGLTALIKKVVDTARYGAGRDWNGITTQLIAWAAGVVLVAATAVSDFAALVQVGEFSLDRLNLMSQVLVGLSLGSAASLVQDGIKAVDGSQSEAKPPLLADKTAP